MRNYILPFLVTLYLGSPSLVAQVDISSFPKIDAKRDWPWWRGPSRDGHAVASEDVPTLLDESKNLDWATEVKGRGHGSPIVVGDRVYLLTADEQSKTHYAVALDRTTGKELWRKPLNQGGFPRRNHAKNTEASPTMACDGERIYATLFHHNAVWAVSLTLDGEPIWEKNLGPFDPKKYEYGYAPSPVLYGDSLIVALEYDGPSRIVSVRCSDAQTNWEIKRAELISFSSPVVTSYEGKDYLLISGQEKVTAYDPRSGETIWTTQGTTMATCGTMVWDAGVVFASGGYPVEETIALEIKTGKVLWRNKQKAYEQSMVATGGHLYSLTDKGMLFCWEGKTGRETWRQRLAGPVSASGVLVGNEIYWANEAGVLWVFQADPNQYKEIGKSQIGEEAFASPAICGGQIFVRVAKQKGNQRVEYLMRFSKR